MSTYDVLDAKGKRVAEVKETSDGRLEVRRVGDQPAAAAGEMSVRMDPLSAALAALTPLGGRVVEREDPANGAHDNDLVTKLRSEQRDYAPSAVAPGPLSDRALNTLSREFGSDIATVQWAAKTLWDWPPEADEGRLQEVIGYPNGWNSPKTLRFAALIRALHGT